MNGLADSVIFVPTIPVKLYSFKKKLLKLKNLTLRN